MSSNPNLPPSSSEPELQGRELMIARMGAIAFGIEQGPNADGPEKQNPTPEHPPEDPAE